MTAPTKPGPGGKREGAGRPRTGVVWVTQAISMQPATREAMRDAAAKAGQSVSEWVRAAIAAKLKKGAK